MAASLGFAQACLAAESPCANPDALGVSRLQEVDTAGGPIFGDIQYTHAASFLRDKEVVLTFDDGPFPETTPAVLAALAEQCTKATFFYVGKMALKNPDILAQVDAAGQTIGAHTWAHADLRKLSGPRALAEIERGVSMLQARLGHPIAPFFRFPYLSDPKADIRYLGGRHFAVFSADVDSWDSHGLTPSAHIVNYVISRLKEQGKGIVLMHDIKHTTAAALPEILRQLKAGGFKIVHLVPKAPAASLSPYDAWARQTIEENDTSALVAANTKVAPAATKVALVTTGKKTGKKQPGDSAAAAKPAVLATLETPKPVLAAVAAGTSQLAAAAKTPVIVSPPPSALASPAKPPATSDTLASLEPFPEARTAPPTATARLPEPLTAQIAPAPVRIAALAPLRISQPATALALAPANPAPAALRTADAPPSDIAPGEPLPKPAPRAAAAAPAATRQPVPSAPAPIATPAQVAAAAPPSIQQAAAHAEGTVPLASRQKDTAVIVAARAPAKASSQGPTEPPAAAISALASQGRLSVASNDPAPTPLSGQGALLAAQARIPAAFDQPQTAQASGQPGKALAAEAKQAVRPAAASERASAYAVASAGPAGQQAGVDDQRTNGMSSGNSKRGFSAATRSNSTEPLSESRAAASLTLPAPPAQPSVRAAQAGPAPANPPARKLAAITLALNSPSDGAAPPVAAAVKPETTASIGSGLDALEAEIAKAKARADAAARAARVLRKRQIVTAALSPDTPPTAPKPLPVPDQASAALAAAPPKVPAPVLRPVKTANPDVQQASLTPAPAAIQPAVLAKKKPLKPLIGPKASAAWLSGGSSSSGNFTAMPLSKK